MVTNRVSRNTDLIPCLGKAGNLPTDETSRTQGKEVIYYDNDKRTGNHYLCN